jgi:acyl dehydratase
MTDRDGSKPTHYEDFAVGDTFEFGSRTVTKAEIVAFAEQYDPQSFHVDEAAAEESLFGELIASGWHTAAVCTRLVVDGLLGHLETSGGRGLDELRWHQPVRPGDELSVQVELVEKRPSESFPGMGEMAIEITGHNQHGDTVISWTQLGLIGRRDGG